MGQTVFFRHRYITAPQLTSTDALLRASDDLSTALKSASPIIDGARTAINKLMEIFRTKAKNSGTQTNYRRQIRSKAMSERQRTEKAAESTQEQRVGEPNDTVPHVVALDDDEDSLADTYEQELEADEDGIAMNGLAIEYPSITKRANAGQPPNLITQDKESSPAMNTRSRSQALMTSVEISNSCPTARQAAARRYPMQFLADFAGAVLDDKTGKLLEYRQLIQRPKYKEDWGFLFRKEVDQLAQEMPS